MFQLWEQLVWKDDLQMVLTRNLRFPGTTLGLLRPRIFIYRMAHFWQLNVLPGLQLCETNLLIRQPTSMLEMIIVLGFIKLRPAALQMSQSAGLPYLRPRVLTRKFTCVVHGCRSYLPWFHTRVVKQHLPPMHQKPHPYA